MKIDNYHNIDLILLADDDVDDCMFFADAVKELYPDVKLVSVNDGEAVMNWLNTCNNLPEIIFLDMNMPCKNGAECLKEIKETDRLKDIPVVIISTSLDDKMIKSLYEAGASWYIKKPNMFAHLKILIANVIKLVRNGITTTPTLNKFVLTAENK